MLNLQQKTVQYSFESACCLQAKRQTLLAGGSFDQVAAF